ncbi:MAG: hypothetical protein DMG89_14425 [Acidobacteria bacterium]|nr:MAG: hypothetical protein DMG89_14425 [Acidobacteriota bacterium]
MKANKTFAAWVLFVAIMLALQLTAVAQSNDEYDPPGRVARMNYVQGSVSFQPGGEGDWVSAVPNRPLTSGDNLWTDRGSRAELHVGSSAIRLSSESSLTFLDLRDDTTQLRLSQGTMVLHVRHLDNNDLFEVNTPNLAFTLRRPGEYRIDVDGDRGETNITVWNGGGEVTGGGNSYDVVAGQEARFYGTDELRYDVSSIRQSDDFYNWSSDRDRREERYESARYVSPEMTGYEDLDEYGRWTTVADYGNVWIPTNVGSDWAPYRDGHWAYISPWGWTWVDDEPWGFAPFHYGRWAYASDRWCWVPGPVAVRPVYAPALVAFVGGPAYSSGVGWFPLAPGEVYVPPYRVSQRYVQYVNVTNTRVNVTQVTNVYNLRNNNGPQRITYANQRITNSVTMVSRDTFVNARPVSRNVVRVDARQVVQAPVVHQLPVQPARTSFVGASAPAKARPPQTVVNRQVVATRKPMPVRAPEQRQPAPALNVRTVTPAARPQPLSAPGNAAAQQQRQAPQQNANERRQAQEPNAQNENTRPQATRPGQPRPEEPTQAQRPQPGRTQEPVQTPRTEMPAPTARPIQPPSPRQAEPAQPEERQPVVRPPEPRDNRNDAARPVQPPREAEPRRPEERHAVPRPPDARDQDRNDQRDRENGSRSMERQRPEQNVPRPEARPAVPEQQRPAAQRPDDDERLRRQEQQREQMPPQSRRPDQAGPPGQANRPDQAERPPQNKNQDRPAVPRPPDKRPPPPPQPPDDK